MTIDEAIAHALEVAESCEWQALQCDVTDAYENHVKGENEQCAADHRQLAEWLRELQELRAKHWDECRQIAHYDDEIKRLEAADVQPVKRGKWCPPLMGQGKFATYCSMCQYTVMRNAAGIFEETPFCPHCGADMRGDTNE